MTEPIPKSEDGSFKLPEEQRPYLEEAIEIGADIASKRTGKPAVVVLDEAERNSEKEEHFFWKNLYNKVKRRLTAN